MTIVDQPTISGQFFGRFHAHGFPDRWEMPSIYIHFCTRPRCAQVQTKLPRERRVSCAGDYSNAAYSLKSHRQSPDEPKTEIDMLYGPAEGRAAVAQKMARDIRLLQTVAEHVASDFIWPMPLSLEMQTCGFPDARLDIATHKLTLCYELAIEFADLYREYGGAEADVRPTGSTTRKKIGASAREPTREQRRAPHAQGFSPAPILSNISSPAT